jgi:hypothetical protein
MAGVEAPGGVALPWAQALEEVAADYHGSTAYHALCPAGAELQHNTFTVDGKTVAFRVAGFGPPAASLASTAALLTDPPLADVALVNDAELRGKVAVVRRGGDGVPFFIRAWRAQQAGALAVVLIHNESDTPATFRGALDTDQAEWREQCSAIAIPALCVGQADGERLLLGSAAEVTFGYERTAGRGFLQRPPFAAADGTPLGPPDAAELARTSFGGPREAAGAVVRGLAMVRHLVRPAQPRGADARAVAALLLAARATAWLGAEALFRAGLPADAGQVAAQLYAASDSDESDGGEDGAKAGEKQEPMTFACFREGAELPDGLGAPEAAWGTLAATLHCLSVEHDRGGGDGTDDPPQLVRRERPLLLSMLACCLAECVTAEEDGGALARPGLAEAWLVSAEATLLHLECKARCAADRSLGAAAVDAYAATIGARAPQRIAAQSADDEMPWVRRGGAAWGQRGDPMPGSFAQPTSGDRTEEASGDLEHESVTPPPAPAGQRPIRPLSTPGIGRSVAAETELAEAWWGMAAADAGECFRILTQGSAAIDRYIVLTRDNRTGAATGITRRHGGLESDAQYERMEAVEEARKRRGAALATSLEMAARGPGWVPPPSLGGPGYTLSASDWPRMRDWHRTQFEGIVYVPDAAGVRALAELGRRASCDDWWAISCLCLRRPPEYKTLIQVMEGSTTGSPYAGQSLFSQIYPRTSGGLAAMLPTAKEVIAALFAAMSSACNEYRCLRGSGGPPRRPTAIHVSYRIRSVWPAVEAALQAVGVEASLETEQKQRLACANNHTDFDTGDTLEGTESASVDAFVGTAVMLKNLVGAAELNGLVGTVESWMPESRRWRVHLPSGRHVNVRPANISAATLALLHGVVTGEAEVGIPREVEEVDATAEAAALAKLETSEPLAEAECCPICMEDIPAGACGLRLPCDHLYHGQCVLPWLREENASCPCCRRLVFESSS